MTASNITLTIAGSTYPIKEKSWSLPDKIEERSKCSFIVQDDNAAYSFKKGQLVTLTDTLQGLLFSGSIHTIRRTKQTGAGMTTPVLHSIECDDKTAILDAKTSNKQYISQHAGAIVVDQIKDLGPLGILANYAIDVDDTQADFAAGTLSGTVAANSVDNGNLELSHAGAKTIITENTTSIFSSGTLDRVTSASNTLAPTSTPAIKIVGTQSLVSDSNAYTYIKIFSSGSISIIASRYLAYDIWIDASSPDMRAGVDIIFTDGSTLRGLTQTYPFHDLQNLLPHPSQNLDGFANDKWYHRKFLLDNFNGKTISHVDVAIEGDKAGTYAIYIKNILEVDVNNGVINTFFNGTLNVNPPKQMQNSGYSNIACTVVDTYDCSTANRVSPSYNIDQTKIAKDSFVSWAGIIPENTNIKLEYSLNGGNSYIECVNNAPLPSLIAGLSLASKTITFRQSFQQLIGASPESKPILTNFICTLNPSYSASKSDVTISATTSAEWNASGTSFTNTQAPSIFLLLPGGVREWSKANTDNMTIYGGGSSGPSTTTVNQHCNYKKFWIQLGNNLEGRSRLDWLGQGDNALLECDIYTDVSYGKVGVVYRTTGWSNWDSNYAYAVEVTPSTVALQKGSNSSQSSTGSRTQLASVSISIGSNSWHQLKVIFNGSNHQVWLDDIKYIDVNDGTYTGSGYVGLRTSNSSTTEGYQGQFNNFGLTVPGLTGSWLSASTSLASASTYGGSVVTWIDGSVGKQSTLVLVESTINGGSSWQAVTNGGSVPNLTAGQSLSGINLRFRITLTTASAASLPQIQYFVCRVLGGFSSSGTRISKALPLQGVGTCGSTLVFWNAITPTNTTVVVATSLDGSSYTNVANGGSISGLNQQPAPTIDSFNLLTSSNYVNTFRSGGSLASWVWDTASSRLTVTGGSHGLLIYNGIASSANVSVYADLDRSDSGGIVLHYANSGSSMYYCVIGDNLASSNPNTVYIYKYDSGGPYTYGNTSISFIRGTYHRFIFQYSNDRLIVSMDGVELINALDSSTPITSGQSGIYNNTGVSRFYNLRIQPSGDSLTNKKVYTRITLTSTDPAATPQVSDFTTLVTNPNIGAGSLIPTADYRNTYRSDNISDLAKQSNYYWNIKPDGSFIFTDRKTVPAPWLLTGNDALVSGLEVEDSSDLYRNRQTITGVLDIIALNEAKLGDGTATSWTLKYNVVSMDSMVLNGQPVTFGVKGIDTGKDFYYEVGSNSIAADTEGTLLIATDELYVSYVGQFETTATRDNTGQFSGTISQRDYIAQSGLTVPSLTLLNQASASQNASGSTDDIDVSLCRRIALDINITAQSGTSPTVQFFLERKTATGLYSILYQSSVISSGSTQISTSIGPGCVTKESLGLTVRLRWTIGGSASPTKTFSASIIGHIDASLAGIGVIEAVEDVSGQNINVAGANALADSRLQQYGVIGRILHFETQRTGLAAGQYLNCFLPELGLNDVALLITGVTRTQALVVDNGSPSQLYNHSVEAIEASILPSWQKAMSDAGVS
jgi:hypothetical protein